MRIVSTFILFILFYTTSIAQVNLNQGLVAHYQLDGHAADSSTNGLNGTISGATNDSGHIGKTNTALRFDGINDYVEVAHNSKFNLTSDKSFSIWTKIESSNQNAFATLFFKQGDQSTGAYPSFGLQLAQDAGYGSNRYKIVYFNGKNSSNKQVFTKEDYRNYLNQWINIIVTYSYSSGYLKIYFNGNISDSTFAPSFAPNTSTDPVMIGRGNKFNFSQSYFKGILDDFRVYDKELNKQEVEALYNERVYFYKTSNITLCQPDSVFAQGEYRNKSGVYYDTTNLGGKCDSVYITNLVINPSYYFPITITICQGNKVLIGGKFRTQAGIYYDSLKTSKGCDSIIEVNLLVNTSYYLSQTIQICQGQSIVIGGTTRAISGTYYDSLISVNGCDSIIETTLIVNTKYTIQQTKEICNGESILLGGSQQTTAGTYYDSLKTSKGCDSIIITTLAVNPKYTQNQSKIICQGDSIRLGGSYQTTSGTYTDVLFTSNGCDSIIVTQLMVNPSYMIQDTKTICQGDSVFIAGSYRYTGSTYYNNLTTSKGCDSIIATTLIVNPSYFRATPPIFICGGDSALINGIYRKTSGIYYDSTTSAQGCDSITLTNLIVTTNSNAVIQNANVLVAQEGNATYQWLDCNNNNTPIAGETSQLFVATTNGDYAVRITKNGCTITSNCVAVIGLSTNRNLTLKQNLKVYPNPARNQVNIELSKTYSEAKVTILSLKGETLHSTTVANKNKIELPTTEVATGIYLIEIIADGNRAYSKLIIER